MFKKIRIPKHRFLVRKNYTKPCLILLISVCLLSCHQVSSTSPKITGGTETQESNVSDIKLFPNEIFSFIGLQKSDVLKTLETKGYIQPVDESYKKVINSVAEGISSNIGVESSYSSVSNGHNRMVSIIYNSDNKCLATIYTFINFIGEEVDFVNLDSQIINLGFHEYNEIMRSGMPEKNYRNSSFEFMLAHQPNNSVTMSCFKSDPTNF